VILGYHGVADSARKDDLFMLQLPPARFRSQLLELLGAGFRFMTVTELALLADGREPPPGIAVVSFDDAMRNNVTTALPILRELGIRATVYVPTGWLGGHSPWIGPGGDGAIMTAEELRELVAAGWELGAHTLGHVDLSQLDYAAARQEIEASCTALARLSGAEIRTLAYPFGRYGPAAVAAARDAGLLAAVTTGSGKWDRYELTRAMIGPADPFPVTWLKLTDRYEPLLSGPPMRFVRRTTKRLRGRLNARRDGEAPPAP
jgi:peptidoglycan/xylan/chitin deacetylase (PgdA/CDA1 family)